MKKVDWKSLIITCMVCLLPILFGIIFYDKLPEKMPVHYNINNEVDRYASKNFAVFGIPLLMTMLQIVCCTISDFRKEQNEKEPRFIKIVKWIIPILSVVISIITIEVPLGSDVDVRKSIMLVLGILYIILGNYLPKMSYKQMKGKMHPMPKSEKMYHKMTRMMGYTFVGFGFLLLISIFFKPMVSFITVITMLLVLILEAILACIKNN